jgi:hypothetical protein
MVSIKAGVQKQERKALLNGCPQPLRLCCQGCLLSAAMGDPSPFHHR